MADLVPVTLARLLIREMADMQLVELRELHGERRFPIAIGLPEAFAIERRCKRQEVERPQTHDLLSNTIHALGGTLTRVEINDLRDGTFFARLIVTREGSEVMIDSRPSDALALAAAGDTPLFVAEHVLAEASIDSSCPDLAAQGSDEDEAESEAEPEGGPESTSSDSDSGEDDEDD